MEQTYILSRHGRILRKIRGANFYTFDEVFYTEGRRSIRFYNEDRKLITDIDSEPGDWVTPQEIGFHARGSRAA